MDPQDFPAEFGIPLLAGWRLLWVSDPAACSRYVDETIGRRRVIGSTS